uniref:Isopropylmalate dehydrogenase-like domain-containing protein n=1 Tax=Zooxanthella nutricula TaxID=1333877 RepID=A0A6U6VWK9_9DINO
MANKIDVSNPIVELDGDEATRTVWKFIKEKLILPYVNLPVKYFDLAIENRIKTEDAVTLEAAAAIKRCQVGIKCSTMEIDEALVNEKSLRRMWKSATVFDRERALRSASSTLRSLMEGANFRAPILTKSIPQVISSWTKPIIVARHVYGDQYRATDIRVEKDCKYQITLTPKGGPAKSYDVCDFGEAGGVAMAMYNSNDRIKGFAHSCFQYALEIKFPVYLSTKELTLRDYDGTFVQVFQEIFESEYKDKFDKAGIWYQHQTIDKMMAFVMRSSGGFIWALKNYDGDIQSEMVTQGFGSAELASSLVLSPDGKTMLTEAHHPATQSSVTQSRGKPAINPMSCIYAWVHGLRQRAKLDGNFQLKAFADNLEAACVEAVEKGKATKDLVVRRGAGEHDGEFLNSEEFVDAVNEMLQEKMLEGAKIMYTLTDEAPMLATYALLPIIRAFTQKSGIEIELSDISVAGRVIAAFGDRLPSDKVQRDELAELGALAKTPMANIVKLPNISASIPQLKGCIAELQQKGYQVPDYPEDPKNAEEQEIRARYAKVLGSAVNPVLREGNSDRRAATAVKNYAKKYPHSMGKWSGSSKTHVAHMTEGDFYASEVSHVVERACEVRIELAAKDGTTTVLKAATDLLPGEVIDASFMSRKHLRAFYKKEIAHAKAEDVLLSLHLKATMMKISDPILFGHMVSVYFEDVFTKHAETFEKLGVNPNNGFGDVVQKIASLPDAQRAAIEADIRAVYEKRPELAMVDSDKGITNLHVPSDVIIDASMPAMIRSSGQMWTPGNQLKDTKACIPDRCYAGVFKEAIQSCVKHGAFDPATMGSVPNVGLMAQKAEEYGSHDKTFEVKKAGNIRVVHSGTGEVLLSHDVEEGDIWRMCQTKDIPIQDWVKLAVNRARATGAKTLFWLDENRAHDRNVIEKVKRYLKQHSTDGLDIDIMAPTEACRLSCQRAREGKDTISVTGNVLRDYNTDLFPIVELGTSAKMLSIVPMLAGGGMYETGAGGSAPKHVEQLVKENHLRWDSLGEYLALCVSLEDLAVKSKNVKTSVLAECLSQATERFLDANKNPGRKTGQLDNRGSHFYLALFWAEALAKQTKSDALKSQFSRIAAELAANETIIVNELIKCQGAGVDIGGYFRPDPEKVEKVMRPSAIFNAILTLGANW